jgi:hypothetical protein
MNFTNLPDTPLNRRLLRRWADQDELGRQLRSALFSEPAETTVLATPKPNDPTVYTTATATFKLLPDEDFEFEDEKPRANGTDGIVISKNDFGGCISPCGF